jgi:quercetin dioxygenase-like cupin family protein
VQAAEANAVEALHHVQDHSRWRTAIDEEIELHPGVVVRIPQGVRHKAKGNLTVLTVCIPRGVLGDVHEIE